MLLAFGVRHSLILSAFFRPLSSRSEDRLHYIPKGNLLPLRNWKKDIFRELSILYLPTLEIFCSELHDALC